MYSLIITILILLAPSVQTEDVVKKKLQQHNEDCFEDYSVNLGKFLNAKSKKYGEKTKLATVEEIITKTYSMNDDIQDNIDGMVEDLLDAIKNCTPDLRAKMVGAEQVTTSFKNFKFILKDNITCLMEYFEKNEF